jgi:CrcB protein
MNYFAIAFGAVFGALSRYALFCLIDNKEFPYSTLVVNIVGCFLVGVAVEYFSLKGNLPIVVKLFFIVGFLGSFTTFSSFALDCGVLVEKGEILKTLIYVGSSVFLGLASYFAAVYIVRNIAS